MRKEVLSKVNSKNTDLIHTYESDRYNMHKGSYRNPFKDINYDKDGADSLLPIMNTRVYLSQDQIDENEIIKYNKETSLNLDREISKGRIRGKKDDFRGAGSGLSTSNLSQKSKDTITSMLRLQSQIDKAERGETQDIAKSMSPWLDAKNVGLRQIKLNQSSIHSSRNNLKVQTQHVGFGAGFKGQSQSFYGHNQRVVSNTQLIEISERGDRGSQQHTVASTIPHKNKDLQLDPSNQPATELSSAKIIK